MRFRDEAAQRLLLIAAAGAGLPILAGAAIGHSTGDWLLGAAVGLAAAAACIAAGAAAARSAAAREAQRWRSRLDATLDATPAGMIGYEPVRNPGREVTDFRILFANDAACRLAGRPREALVGRTMLSTFPGSWDRGLFARCRDVMESGEPYAGEVRFEGEGTETFLGVTAIRTGESVTATFIDRSECRRLASELIDARRRAELVTEAKSRFLAMMSHELRTPMNGILGFTQLLSGTELTAQQRDYVATLASSGDALVRILNDVLDFSKAESGKLVLERRSFAIRPMVEAVAEVLVARGAEKQITLRAEVAPSVPDWVVGDEARLRQVLMNLGGNAVKFTDRGEVSIRVRSELVPGCDRVDVEFEVADTGPGVPQELLFGPFVPFTRSEAGNPNTRSGTGIGLSICKRLVDLMGGKISARNRREGGARFTVTVRLPIGAAPDAGANSLPRLPEFDGAATRILVAEDDATSAKLLLRVLKILGYETHHVLNGRAAVDEFEAGNYEFIFMDINMPEMDGFAAARAIRARVAQRNGSGRQPYIVAITANAMSGEQERCLAAGMDAYLPKPLKIPDVSATLSRAAIVLRERAAAKHDAPGKPIDLPAATKMLCAEAGAC